LNKRFCNGEFIAMSIFKNNFVVGLTAGLAAAVIAPALIPALKKGSRPLAKSMVKGSILLYDKGREMVAGAGEMMEDVIAELQAEEYQKQAASAKQGEAAAETQSQSHGGTHLSSVRKESTPGHGKEGGPT
jgi:hypothetical protein